MKSITIWLKNVSNIVVDDVGACVGLMHGVLKYPVLTRIIIYFPKKKNSYYHFLFLAPKF